MKPISLLGHERSITQIKYNREGDLLFSSAKDTHPTVWYSINGERLGTFEGHTGAVWCIDVNWESTKVLTGAADCTCKMWDLETGKMLAELEYGSAIRTCGFSFSGNNIMTSTDRTMGKSCEIQFYDIRDGSQLQNNEPYQRLSSPDSKVTSAVWSNLDKELISGHDNGALCLWDLKTGDILQEVEEHRKGVNDIQLNRTGQLFVTASKDTTAKLFNATTLQYLKTYKTDRPVNSASISPLKEHICLGGGQEAMDVTTTSARVGKFETKFFHMIFEEEFARFKGHFGPINSVAFHPDGKSCSTGGEDGFVKINYFDSQYFEFEFEV